MKNTELKMIKLITAEVIVGTVLKETENELVLGHPIMIDYTGNTGAIAMIPYDEQYTEVHPEEKQFDKQFIIDTDMTIGTSILNAITAFHEDRLNNETSDASDASADLLTAE